jgi:hypothetical protein
LILSSLVYSGLFYAFYRKESLPQINEESLLVYTLLFWPTYLSATPEAFSSGNADPFYIFAFLASFGVLMLSFVRAKPPVILRLFSYLWFLAIIIYLIYPQTTDPLYKVSVGMFGIYAAISLFLLGMVCLQFSVYAFSIYLLIPVPFRGEGIGGFVKRWTDHAFLLTRKFSNRQMQPQKAVVLIVLISGTFIFNFYQKVLSLPLLVNLIIVLHGFFLSVESFYPEAKPILYEMNKKEARYASSRPSKKKERL